MSFYCACFSKTFAMACSGRHSFVKNLISNGTNNIDENDTLENEK